MNHISEIVERGKRQLYFLCQLKRAQVKSEELLLFYLTLIRPVTEYTFLVYRYSNSFKLILREVKGEHCALFLVFVLVFFVNKPESVLRKRKSDSTTFFPLIKNRISVTLNTVNSC